MLAENDKGLWYQQQECTTSAVPSTSLSRKKLEKVPGES